MKKPFFTSEEEELIKQQAPKAEAAGTFTPKLLQLAERKKLFHLSVPESMGGHEMPVPNQLDFYEEASRLDGSFGWTVKLGAGAGLFSAFMDQEFARKIFRNPAAFTAGSGYPAGTAKYTGEGTYRINGRWKYISGIHHATLFTANCRVENRTNNPANEPEIRAMAFLPDEIEKLDTWRSFGLKASASHDFSVTDLEISEERSFVLEPRPEHEGKPLFHYPFMGYAPAAIASSILGMTFAFLDEAEQHIGQPLTIRESIERLHHNRTTLHDSVSQLWKECSDTLQGSQARISRVNKTASSLAQTCRETALETYKLSGMKVLDETSRFNRTWRDLMTASQHTMVN
ncbi:acyl-CoA dehydrogenase family protein [Rhodohalobacter sp. 8-1]|uniref:acyl-CoA dehydrogenase family protein n=1 Tax=Rhodohalobacter sp. 8-1 TaxID=3131972 RepID=UPI0030EDC2FB